MNGSRFAIGAIALVAGSLLLLLPGCVSSTITTQTVTPVWRTNAPLPEPDATIVIVPFENLSSSRNAGLIVTDLANTWFYTTTNFQVVDLSPLSADKQARLRQLEVTPWERQIGLNTSTAMAVGQTVRADWVLAGSVGEYGFVDGFGETATVGINVRLVHAQNGIVVWAGSLSRRANCTAFSEESVHRLAHGVVRDLFLQLSLAIDERKKADAEAARKQEKLESRSKTSTPAAPEPAVTNAPPAPELAPAVTNPPPAVVESGVTNAPSSTNEPPVVPAVTLAPAEEPVVPPAPTAGVTNAPTEPTPAPPVETVVPTESSAPSTSTASTPEPAPVAPTHAPAAAEVAPTNAPPAETPVTPTPAP